MSQKKKRNIIIGTLCGVLLLMVIGYAAFNTVLNIKGTSNISSNWDIKITDIEKVSSKGATDNEGSPSYENLSATFNTNFTTPGDYATYKIEITNNGSMDAVLKTITIPENTNNDILFYLNKNQSNTDIADVLKQNDTLFKKGETGNVGYVYVTVLYKDYENQKTATTKTQSMTITFDFEQADGSSIPTPTTQIVYRWTTDNLNIGDSIEGIETTTDSSTLGKNYYLKHEIDSENKITASYVCFITDTEHCMQGGDTSYYESSKALLQSQEEWFVNNSGSCTFDVFSSHCNGGGFSDVIAAGGGSVDVYDNSSDCYVNSGGSSCA